MANKFLGEAGLGVLTEEIKKKTYVGQKLDEVLAALEYMAALEPTNGEQIDDSLMEDPETIHALVITEGFYQTILATGAGIVQSDAYSKALQKLKTILGSNVMDGVDFTYDQHIRSSAILESFYFDMKNMDSTNIQEITAQEVTNKFNS